METDTRHTPTPKLELPWRVAYDTRIEYGPIVAGFGFCIAEVKRDPVDWQAKRDFMVKAVNSHDALVEALRGVVGVGESYLLRETNQTAITENRKTLESARALLSQLEGK